MVTPKLDTIEVVKVGKKYFLRGQDANNNYLWLKNDLESWQSSGKNVNRPPNRSQKYLTRCGAEVDTNFLRCGFNLKLTK